MPSLDGICAKFNAAVLAENPHANVPKHEEVLVSLLEDKAIRDALAQIDFDTDAGIAVGRLWFKKSCERFIKDKFNVIVTLDKTVSDCLLWYCNGVLKVTDYLLKTPRLSTDPQLSIQHFNLVDSMFLQEKSVLSETIKEILKEPLVIASDELVPLLIVTQNRLFAVDEVRFAQINLDAFRLCDNIPKFSDAAETNDPALSDVADVEGVEKLHSLVTAVVCARDYVATKKKLTQPVEPDDFTIDESDNNDDHNSKKDIDYHLYMGLQGFLLQICDEQKPGKFDELFLDTCRKIFGSPQFEKSGKAQQILAIANNDKSNDSDKVSQILWCVEDYATGLQSAKAFFKSKFGTQTEKYTAFNMLKHADHSTNSKMYKLIEQLEVFARQLEKAADKQAAVVVPQQEYKDKADASVQRAAIANQQEAVASQQNASGDQQSATNSGTNSLSSKK